MLSKIDFGKRSNRHPERGRGGVEESRRVTLKLLWRDPSTFVPDNDGLSVSSETSARCHPEPRRWRCSVRYPDGLRAKIFPRPDFQVKCERMADETNLFAVAIARASSTPFANSAVIAAE